MLVADLLDRDIDVTAIVRASSSLADRFQKYSNYREVEASITEMPDRDLAPLLEQCDAVLSCLGHNLSFKGIFGQPRRLVTQAIAKICRVIESTGSDRKIKVVIMNTTGNSNRDIPEKPPLSQRFVVAILRILLPPHVDNEQAADYLRVEIGQNHPRIEWAAVRPDGLIDESEVTAFQLHASPTRNAIFDAGSTSRINVAHFMASLVDDPELWATWCGRMPVIYNND